MRGTKLVWSVGLIGALAMGCGADAEPNEAPDMSGNGGSSGATNSDASGGNGTATTGNTGDNATGGTMANTGGNDSTTGDATAGTNDGPDEVVPPSGLPFAVDDYFYPSGYMGDGQNMLVTDEELCGAQRPADAMGTCHRFTWTPGTEGWAGVYWQHPDMNWGSQSGLALPAGATAVTFTAWGSAGGEIVSFMTGMMDADGFEVKEELTLTAEPTEYTLSLAGVTYTDVVGGFGWVAEGATSPVEFFVDDIRWE